MKFAPIVPVQYDPGKFVDYHLILAHEVLEDDDLREYYQYLALQGHTILLDNSVVELGEAVGVELLEEAYKYFPDAYLVLPDALANAEKTIAFADEWLSRHRENNRLMVVAQGKTPGQWQACLDTLYNMLSSHCNELLLGIPRISEDFEGGREALFNKAMERGIWGPYHLLGIQHTLNEVMWAKNHRFIWGVDSSLPGRAALVGEISSRIKDLRKVPDLTEYNPSIHERVQQEIVLCKEVLDGKISARE